MMAAAQFPLADKADVIRGVTFSKGDATSQPREGYVPVLRAGNIRSHLILDDDLVYVPERMVSDKQWLRRGDIVMCTSSGSSEIVGKTAFTDRDWSGSFGAFCAVVRPKADRCHPRYLFHYLQSPRFRDWTRNSSGVGIKNIRKSELDAVQIPFPSPDEQRRIATILDKADAIRCKREQALILANGFIQSMFLEMFGDPLSNPMGWPVKTLGAHLEEIRYGTSEKCGDETPERDIPVLRIPNVVNGVIDWTDLKFTSLNAKERERMLLFDGDILFVRTNGNPNYIGRCAVFEGNRPAAFASYLIRARLRDDSPVSPRFVSTCFSMPSYRSRMIQEAKTTAGNYNANTTGLRSLPIIEPPKEMQAVYARVVASMNKTVVKIASDLTEANDLFASLSQRAFRDEL